MGKKKSDEIIVIAEVTIIQRMLQVIFLLISGFLFIISFFGLILKLFGEYNEPINGELIILVIYFIYISYLVRKITRDKSVYYKINEKKIVIGKDEISINMVKFFHESASIVNDTIKYSHKGKLKKAKFLPITRKPYTFLFCGRRVLSKSLKH